jgi:hypothetical protein
VKKAFGGGPGWNRTSTAFAGVLQFELALSIGGYHSELTSGVFGQVSVCWRPPKSTLVAVKLLSPQCVKLLTWGLHARASRWQ